MNERGRQRSISNRDGGDEGVICPKPRRVAFGISSVTDIVTPAPRPRSQGSLAAEADAGGELLDILFRKDAAETGSCCSSWPFFTGSPPSRASNPLIHDVQFTQKRLPPPPLIMPAKSSLGSPFGTNSSLKNSSCSVPFGANPSVRVEGFVSASSDSHRGVAALA
eukprot:c21595_g1_i2 orf=660-1154(-)